MILRNREAEALGMHASFARQYVHQCPAEGCPYRAARDGAWLICAGGHRMEAMQMSARNKQLANVRLWLHNQMCASECSGDRAYDHARRTQHEQARSIVDASDDDTRRRAIHDALCVYAARGIDCYAQHPAGPLDRAMHEIRLAMTVGAGGR